ncbi:alpha/beta fold hydrolase [Streptosporangium sp. NPDC000396]|uniref:alpha/beta fold hydrolase n=1 Tax=Streptosporangium sp. NPDC000396 TaxID=3366185 RepID=UPI00368658DD
MTTIRNIVLVHGGFVDGSDWQGVYDELARDGFSVRIVQNLTLSLAGDVAATRQVLDGLDGPAVLVGHSYGGVVISEADTHPNVGALAYIAADLPASTTRLMQATQRPFAASSYTDVTTAAAWRTIPSWALVATQDKAIPPALERFFYRRAKSHVYEAKGASHVPMMSQPGLVTRVIKDAAHAVG